MKKKKKNLNIALILAPLIALTALGASSYLWYKALVPEASRMEIRPPFQASKEVFSAGLKGNLAVAMADFNIGEKDIKARPADEFEDQINTIYTITIPSNLSLTLVNLRITRMVHAMGGNVIRGLESNDKGSLSLTLGVGKKATDIVIIKKRSGVTVKTTRIAIVIDDLGIKDIDLARRLCALDRDITLAILPFQRHTSEIVRLAHSTQTPYILHMPMEPKSDEVNPGKGAILVSDNDSDIKKKLDRAFDDVDGARGLNNHMGSKATEDPRVMECLMKYLGTKTCFFLDSQTSRESVGFGISRKVKIPGAKITGYIDAVDQKEEIEKRLDDFTKFALENGTAIILGHDRPLTVEILERKLPEMEQAGITFVPLTDLIR